MKRLREPVDALSQPVLFSPFGDASQPVPLSRFGDVANMEYSAAYR